MEIKIAQERKKALLWGGGLGVILCATSLIAVTYFNNSQFSNIGFLIISPVFYMPLPPWQLVVIAFIYLGIFSAAYPSLLISIKHKAYRISTGILILSSMTVLHGVYAKLYFVQ